MIASWNGRLARGADLFLAATYRRPRRRQAGSVVLLPSLVHAKSIYEGPRGILPTLPAARSIPITTARTGQGIPAEDANLFPRPSPSHRRRSEHANEWARCRWRCRRQRHRAVIDVDSYGDGVCRCHRWSRLLQVRDDRTPGQTGRTLVLAAGRHRHGTTTETGWRYAEAVGRLVASDRGRGAMRREVLTDSATSTTQKPRRRQSLPKLRPHVAF